MNVIVFAEKDLFCLIQIAEKNYRIDYYLNEGVETKKELIASFVQKKYNPGTLRIQKVNNESKIMILETTCKSEG